MAAKKKSKAKAKTAKRSAKTTAKPAARARVAAKPAARAPVAAKSSPVKGMPVAKWLASKTSGWQADVIERIIGLTKRAAPDATLSIKWAQPVFEVNGPFAFIKPARAHVTFGFWRGAELGDPAGVLEGDGVRMKHVKIASSDALNEARLAAFVREAVALNRAKGDPTR